MRYVPVRFEEINSAGSVGWLATSHGYGVIDTNSGKLTSVNAFSSAEAVAEFKRLNEAETVRAHWPDARDPEVVAMVADEEWGKPDEETYVYRVHRASEVIARRRAQESHA